ncbi:MAG: CotH kinase family protein [Planctomycetota bacterium]|nr:CotH kinase family protein [Planctomycetota bacterium]
MRLFTTPLFATFFSAALLHGEASAQQAVRPSGLPLAQSSSQSSSAALPPGPALTEFLARNDDGLEDEDGDRSDWIEIHNVAGAGTVDLDGWSLTDDAGALTKWTFGASTVLPAGGFVVVFASGKDRRISAGTLHTNFRLSGGGEYLALVNPAGTVVNEYAPEYPPQAEDVSYGLSFNPGATDVERLFTAPSPGAPNGVGAPPVWGVTHTPQQPTDAQDLIVTAQAPTTTAGLPTVDLDYRVMYGGVQTAPMADDGVAPDLVAGDAVYTGVIPSGVSGAGEMVRYRVTVADGLSSTALPFFLEPLGSPEWFGTVVADPSHAGSPLDVWEWFVQNPGAANTSNGTRCSIWIEGEFYDNVKVNRRGQSSAGYPRKSYKFDFNPDDRPELEIFGAPIDEANLNTHWADKAHVRQFLSYGLYEEVGSLVSKSFPVRLQQNGDFYSVQTFVEELDRFFLERVGVDPDGALYKMYNPFTSGTSSVEKVTRTNENNADLSAFVSTVAQGGPGMEDYLFDVLDVPRVMSYLVACWLIHENDHLHKNHFLYRDSDGDGEWQFIPWDKDLTWGRNYNPSGGVLNDRITYNHPQYSHVLFGDSQHRTSDNFWNRLINRIYESPRLRTMYLRRLRTVCDELLQPPGTPAGELRMELLVNGAYTSMAADIALDEARWGVPTWGTPRNFQQAKDRMLTDYVASRRLFLYGPQLEVNGGLVPEADSGRTRLRITAFDADPASGNKDEEFLELTNDAPWSTDLSGYQVEGGVTMTLPPGTVVEAGGRVYISASPGDFRARAVAPTGGEGHFVVGPFDGNLAPGETVLLRDRAGRIRARRTL